MYAEQKKKMTTKTLLNAKMVIFMHFKLYLFP